MDAAAIVWCALSAVAGGVIVALAMEARNRRRAGRESAAVRRADLAERNAEIGSMTAGLAHEIRNPLSTIVLNADLAAEEVRESALPPESREPLERRLGTLARETRRLKDILEDFLRFAGRLRLDRTPVDLGKLVEEFADFHLPQALAAGVTQSVEVPPGPTVAEIDADHVKQVLLNLVLNAVQAMQAQPADRPRKLTLRLARGVAPGRPPEALLTVEDTGPGIDPRRHESIFRPYLTDKPGGTGLGLALSRRIAEAHGGRLEIDSAPGRGSCFTLRLPLGVPPTPASPSP
jgi:signal transduction histidine kinase